MKHHRQAALEDAVAHKAYPQLFRTPEIWGIHRFCFELGAVFGYILFYLSKDLKVTLVVTLSLILFINFYLKKDPRFFQIRKHAVKVHYLSFGFFRPVGQKRKPLHTLLFVE
ncbi:MAG: hypothetical protein QNK37_35245 [Acidobacteriota bacterium]|nr:hypothetical protein [Acidobacteriota bacterium]